MNREDWGSLAAFAVVAQERSFTRAAARLGVSPSALSHTLRRLEERLGVQLLARSTRSVSTTQAGEQLLARVNPAIDEISHAVADVGAGAGRPSGLIRISAPRHAVRTVIAPMLPAFIERHPGITVEILVEHAFTDIVARRIDAGIRLGESLEKDVVAVPISGPLRMVVAGSPKYLASHAAPTKPRDLRDHRCINIRMPAAGTLYKWEFAKGRESIEVAVDGNLIFDDADLIVDAAAAGLGLCYVFEDRVAPHLETGTLRCVLDDWCQPFPGFFLYYPGRRQVSPALAAFIEAIRGPSKARKGR